MCRDRLWFVDYVSPFSRRHTLRLNGDLRAQLANRVARGFRVARDSKKARVVIYFVRNVDEGWRRTADRQIVSHFAIPATP